MAPYLKTNNDIGCNYYIYVVIESEDPAVVGGEFFVAFHADSVPEVDENI